MFSSKLTDTAQLTEKRIQMKYIDLGNWKRKGHYDFFHRMDYPQFNICMDIDVSNFVKFTKQKRLSFLLFPHIRKLHTKLKSPIIYDTVDS
jgi:chloramphenicol O-acetyltransferase